MCGRFTSTASAEVLAEEFGLHSVASGFAPSFNVAPSHLVPVVTRGTRRSLELFQWGLIPSWARDPAVASQLINARCESVGQKPSFRDAYARRRCLVVADGFYEWTPALGGKTPMYVRLRSRRPFAFAGLWEAWLSPAGEVIRTCTIITTEANRVLKPIHPRMPVILPEAAREAWLADHDDVAALRGLLRPYPDDELECFSVSDRVNSPRNNGPQCIVPQAPRGTLPLFPDWGN
jgi:putative SOS response-associated peptidase YedK